MTVVSGDVVADSGGFNVNRLKELIPSVQLYSSNPRNTAIGIRGQGELSENLFFRYNGDIGGFGASSDLVWQAFAGLGYRLHSNFSLVAGYRGMGVDYDNGRFMLDTVTHGPVIGLDVRF